MSLAVPKLMALSFIKQMFVNRGYEEAENQVYDGLQHVLVLESFTADKRKVMACLAECENTNHAIGALDCAILQDGVNTGEKVGTDMINRILEAAQKKGVAILILVSDSLTHHSAKVFHGTEHMQVTHFTYAETSTRHMNEHMYQPITFRALSADEKRRFQREQPHYATHLPRISWQDPLVKYHGFLGGDIIYSEQADRQTGHFIEYYWVDSAQDLKKK